MKVLRSKEFLTWLSINVLLPIVVPVGFMLCMNIVVRTGLDFGGILKEIIIGGGYIFLSLFVLLSLSPHFSSDESRGVPRALYGIILGAILVVTCFLYMSYLEIVPGEEAISFPENFVLSVVVLSCGILFAIGFKISVICKDE
jgi:hypothetical protein